MYQCKQCLRSDKIESCACSKIMKTEKSNDL